MAEVVIDTKLKESETPGGSTVSGPESPTASTTLVNDSESRRSRSLEAECGTYDRVGYEQPKDLVDIASNYPSIVKNLTPREIAHLNATLLPGYDKMTDEKLAEYLGVFPTTLRLHRHKQKWLDALRELHKIEHRAGAVKVRKHMFNNALDSRDNKQSMLYLQGVGEAASEGVDIVGAQQVGAAIGSAMDRIIELEVERRVNETLKAHDAVKDVEYTIETE